MDKQRKLTAKQTEIIRIMKNVGSQFVSFKDCDMRTYEILVKRGIFTVAPDTMGFGKFYRLTEV